MNRSHIFLACYRETGSVTKAADAAQIQRSIHYRRLERDAAYKAAFEEAKAVAVEVLEDEALRRAVEGVEEPLTYQGRFSYADLDDDGNPMGKPLAIRKYSDSLLQFLLRGAKPEKYRERHQVEHTGVVSIVERLQAGRKRAARTDDTLTTSDDA